MNNPKTEVRYRNEVMRPIHEKNILQFLWDEGPQTSFDVALHIELSLSHVRLHLCGLKAEGKLDAFRRDGMGYWMIAEDFDLEAAA